MVAGLALLVASACNYGGANGQTTTVVSPAPTISVFTAAQATVTMGAGTTLLAVFSNGTGTIDQGVGTISSGATVAVTPTATTTYTLTVTGAGGTITQSTSITVNPMPVATITPSVTLATVGTPGLAASVPSQPGDTYLWTATGGSITSGQGTAQIIFTAGSGAAVVLGVTVTNPAGTANTGGASIALVAAPVATVTAPANVTASQAGYAASVPAQIGCSFAWTISGGALTSATTGTSVTFTAGTSGSVQLGCTATNAAGTVSTPGTATSTIVAAPAQPTVSAPASVTASQAGYAASVLAQTNCSYAWTITGGTLTSATTGTSVTFTAGPSGTVQLSCTVANAAGTLSTPGTATSTVLAAAVQPTITAPANVTASQAGYAASIPAQSGCTYAWFITGGTLTSALNGTSVTFTAGLSGTVQLSCIVTNAAGSPSTSGTAVSTVLVAASQPTITAPANVTADQLGYGASVPAQSGCTYAWTISGGTLTSATTGTSVIFTAGSSGSVQLSCIASNAAGTPSTPGTAISNVVVAPAQPVLTAPAIVTANQTGYTASVPAQVGCTFAWSITGGILTNGTVGTSVTFTAGLSGSVQLSCMATNLAGTPSLPGTATSTILVAPAQPVVTAPLNVTASQAGYSASVPTQLGCSFAWTISGGAITSATTGTSVTFTAGASGLVQISCIATNGAGSPSPAGQFVSTVVPVPVMPTVTAPTSVTANQAGYAASVPLQGTCTYAWAISGGTLTSATTGISVTFTAGPSGTVQLSCTVLNPAGAPSTPGTAISTVVAAATQPTITAPSNVTANQPGYAASVSAQLGCTYAWTIAGGVFTTSPSGTSVTFTAGPSGTVQLTCMVTNSAGTPSTPGTSSSTVVVAPVSPTIAAPANVTANQAGYTASITAQAGCTYAWSITGGAMSSPTTGTSVTFTAGPTGSVLLSCTVTNAAGTPSSPGSTSCAVVPPATQPTVTAPGNVTAGQAGYTASIMAQAGCTYAWTIAGGALTSTTTGTSVTFTPGGSGQVQLSCTVTDAGSTSAPAGTATCTIVAVPTQPTLTYPAVVTASHAGLIASVPLQAGCTYAWVITGGAITSATIGTSVTFTAGNSGSVQLSCTVTNAASTAATPGTATCTIVPALSPVVTTPPTVTAGQTGCVASVTPLTAAAYVWSITGGSFTSGSTGTSVTFTAGASGSVQLNCNLTNAAGDVYSASGTSSIVLGIAGTASTFPRGTRTLTPSGGSGAGYTWSLFTNNSGGSIVPGTGVYTAGSTGGVTDTVQLMDSLSNTTTATIAVSAGVAIAPATLSLAPRATQSLTASGGSGTGYTWSMATNNSGGTIDASTGLYTAGTTGHVADLVRVLDSLGNTATLSVSITAGPATHVTVTGFTNPTTSAVAHQVTIMALDQDNNTANGYLGTVHITSSDPLVVAPADYTFQASDNGVHALSATLRTAGTQSITATDTVSGSITGAQAGITVQAAGAASLALSGFQNPTTTNGPHNLTMRALDAAGNTATGYRGTVHFTSTDPQAVLPADYTFTALDAGLQALSFTLKTLGSQSITATDMATSSITGTQAGITVNDVAPSGLTYTYTATTFTTNIAASTDTPSSGGGPVVSYAVAPALPTGLTLSTSTGIITGTPTTYTPLATYTVTATNSGGSTTVGLDFKVLPPGPTFSAQPASITVASGGTAAFSVTASGASALTYQWQKNGTNIAGATANSYTTPALGGSSDGATFRVIVTDTYASQNTSSDATLTVSTWTSKGALVHPRSSQTATMLPTGQILIMDGKDPLAVANAEEFNPVLGTSTDIGPPAHVRTLPAATLLINGTVLISGGGGSHAELYHSDTHAFTDTVQAGSDRANHSATLLQNGWVLLAGGSSGSTLATAEIYKPAGGTFTATALNMTSPRKNHLATLLTSGKVLITGGDNNGTPLVTAEVYDPVADTFTATNGPMSSARVGGTATLLGNGKVLLAGGLTAGGLAASTELYDPTTGLFAPTGSLITARQYPSAALLTSGKVLLIGGFNSLVAGGYLLSTELFDPVTETFSPAGSLLVGRMQSTVTVLSDGTVLAVGGQGLSGYLSSAELSQ